MHGGRRIGRPRPRREPAAAHRLVAGPRRRGPADGVVGLQRHAARGRPDPWTRSRAGPGPGNHATTEDGGGRRMSARILVVDDSTSMRQMVSFALTSAGYEVKEAEDGQVALGHAQKERFNAVITDVNMPNMDGIALIRELRQLPDYKFTPLLMLTTESGTDRKADGRAAGATGWMVKPFDPDQLVAT